MKKRYLIFVLTLFILAAFVTGCAANTAMPDYEEGGAKGADEVLEEPAAMPEASMDAGVAQEAKTEASVSNGGYSSNIVVPDTTRKIVLTQYIETMTKNFDEDIAMLNNALEVNGGYFQEKNISGTKPTAYKDRGRTAFFIFRVPKNKAESFVKAALTAGEVISDKSSGQDITGQYMDTDARLKTLRIRLDRLQALEQDAKKMADIIELEKSIQEVTYEIESLEGQIRGWDNLVDYVTIQMSIEEINTIPKTLDEEKPIDQPEYGEQLRNGFNSVLSGLLEFFKVLGLIIVAGSPIIVPVAVIVLIIIFSVRAGKKKKMNKQL